MTKSSRIQCITAPKGNLAHIRMTAIRDAILDTNNGVVRHLVSETPSCIFSKTAEKQGIEIVLVSPDDGCNHLKEYIDTYNDITRLQDVETPTGMMEKGLVLAQLYGEPE